MKKIIYYTLKIVQYILLVSSFLSMLSAVFFAVFYFFVPRTYDWYVVVTANKQLSDIYLGTFSEFLKFDATVFFIGFVGSILSVIISRLALSYRAE